jgi:SAM-dependent methyltransferase
MLPFKDGVFDAVISIAVLEHVKFPWMCAKEILRVLKPGGDLIICVPFLQPLHGYPNHFFNMTQAGLQSLFGSEINIIRHEVPISVHPIWSLQWILNSWAMGLNGDTKMNFLNMKVADFLSPAQSYLDKDFVKNLSIEKNFELASATVLHGVKVKSSIIEAS